MVHIDTKKLATVVAILLVVTLLLVACGGSSQQAQTQKPTPTPSPTPGPGQQLLAKVGQNLTTAKTLHGIFDLTISGPTFSGMVNEEIWNAAPNKVRTVVLQSSLVQMAAGSITVSDGKQLWEYDPTKNVVYTGPVSATATSNSGPTGGGQSQLFFNLVRSIFSRSAATLVSSSATVNGHSADDLHVTPSNSTLNGGTGTGFGNFSYDGDIYIDKTTNLPLRANLNIQGIGQIRLNFPMLTLNQPIAASTFTFTPPAGAKVQPLPQSNGTPGAGSGSGDMLTLAQAQQQAGYHLLSIPASQTDYELEGVTVLGATGSQLFTLNYIKGNQSFTITEGKSLANLPNSGGQSVTVRGVTGSLATTGGSSTLAWTENGIGIRIAGNISGSQAQTIAGLLT